MKLDHRGERGNGKTSVRVQCSNGESTLAANLGGGVREFS